MDKRVKARWIAALRSGKYRQGRGKLKMTYDEENQKPIPESFCCLGVLCDIRRDVKWEGDVAVASKHSRSIGELPFNLRCKLNISEEDVQTLQEMNDGTGNFGRPKSFRYIANWIDKKL